jgi:hypothetical protein
MLLMIFSTGSIVRVLLQILGIGISTGAAITFKDVSFLHNEAKYRGGGHYQCECLNHRVSEED